MENSIITQECLHFILIHIIHKKIKIKRKKKIKSKVISSLTTVITMLSGFLSYICTFTQLCAESSSSSSQKKKKKQSHRKERGGSILCANKVMQETQPDCPPSHLPPPHMMNRISADRDECEWATWNLMRFNEQPS